MKSLIFLFLCVSIISAFDLTSSKNESLSAKRHKFDTECRAYHKLNASEWCKFVNSTPNCQMDEGFINYIKVAFCDYKPKFLPAIAIVYALWLVLLFVGLGTTAEAFFCPSLEFIANNLKLSQNIAGLTIVAFGNGSPDIFSAIAAFTNPNPTAAGVAIGSLLGAAMFITTVVAGSVARVTSFDVAQRPFLRDLVFFLATVFWTFLILFNGEITLLSSVGFLCLYLFYVVVVAVGRAVNQRLRAEKEPPQIIVPSLVDEATPLLKPPVEGLPRVHSSNTLNDWTQGHLRSHSGNWSGSYNSSVCGSRRGSYNANVPPVFINKVDINGAPTEVRTDPSHSDLPSYKVLLLGLSPIDAGEWREASRIFRIVLVLQAPWVVVCKLTVPVIHLGAPQRGWNRPLNCTNLLLAPLFCTFALKGGHIYLNNSFPLWALMLLVGAALMLAVWFTSNNQNRPVYHGVFAYIGFVVAVIWTYTVANEIVNLLQTFGTLLNVTNVIMGLTFLAWGNSIGDMVADVTLARQGFPRMSLSACFGGPLFNLLIGIGLPCTISIVSRGKPIMIAFTSLEAVLSGGLLVSLCLTFVIIPLCKFRFTKKYGYFLWALYACFLTVAILTGLEIF